MRWIHPERHPGDVLLRRFLEPLGLSADDVARDAGIPKIDLDGILRGELPIGGDVALRLGRWLRMEPEFWMSLQGSWDLARLPEPDVTPARTAGFVIGPEGALRLPPPRPRAPVDARVSEDLRGRIEAAAALGPEDEPRVLEHVRFPDGRQAFVSRPR